MKTLILGGIRSGKSRLAESMAKDSGKKVVYIATATAGDEEMKTRINLHKLNRPDDWLVVEEPLALADVIHAHTQKNYCILIDCLTLWITNLLLEDDGTRLKREREKLVTLLADIDEDIIFVANETSMGIIPLGELSRQFGDEAGITNQIMAANCDQVIMTIAGLPLTLKGKKYETGMA